MKISFYSLLLFLTIVSSNIFAQGKIKGQVFTNNNEPVEFANIRLFSIPDSTVIAGAYTEVNGSFLLENIPIGDYYSAVTYFGFDELIISDIKVSNQHETVDLKRIILNIIQSQELDEIVVVGEGPSIMESSIDKRTYNVDQDMTSMGGDAADILNNIPSIEVDNEGNISLRGSGGVRILIDGRESAMTSGDDPLAGIPASAIERVEIVTNPSARYSPEGTAGIINIVLKKTKMRGFNGNISLTAATGNLYNGSVNFNYRNEKVNVFANYGFRYSENLRRNYSKRYTFIGDDTQFLDQDNGGDNLRRSHTASLGADFFLKANHTLGVSVSGSDRNRKGWGLHSNNLYWNDNLVEYWNRDVEDPRGRNSIDINTNYKWDFTDEKAGSLMLTATGSIGNNRSYSFFKEHHYDGMGTPLVNGYRFQEQDREGETQRYSFNADLTRAINDKMKYETGLEVRINRMRDDNLATIFDTVTSTVIEDLNTTNRLVHDEDFYSAYGIFAHDVTKLFKYQIGLRLEQAFVSPQFITSNQNFSFQYFKVYPSVHLAFGDDDMGTFFLSYSRRVSRPRHWQMNPFPRVDDPQNIRKGNPGLQPEFINSIELGYEKMWENGSIATTGYFRHTENKIQRLTEFTPDGVSISTFDNINQAFDYGLEIIGTYNPFPWWRNMLSFNAYESRLKTTFNGEDLSNKGITWDMKINTTFSFFNGRTNVQFNGGYSSPRHTVQGVSRWNPGFDFGVTQSFLDKNLIFGIRVSDVFDQQGYYSEVYTQNREQETQYKWTSRRLHFTVTYKFGNLKLKEDQQKRRGFEGGDDGEMM